MKIYKNEDSVLIIEEDRVLLIKMNVSFKYEEASLDVEIFKDELKEKSKE